MNEYSSRFIEMIRNYIDLREFIDNVLFITTTTIIKLNANQLRISA